MFKCKNCGSDKITSELRVDGFCTCEDCGDTWKKPTTAEKLLWLVENKYLAFVEYNEKNGFVGIGLNAWDERILNCPIIPTYKRNGQTTGQAINAAYEWAQTEKAKEQE